MKLRIDPMLLGLHPPTKILIIPKSPVLRPTPAAAPRIKPAVIVPAHSATLEYPKVTPTTPIARPIARTAAATVHCRDQPDPVTPSGPVTPPRAELPPDPSPLQNRPRSHPPGTTVEPPDVLEQPPPMGQRP